MEQNKKSKLILLLCLIVSAVLLEALLVWVITPRSEHVEDYDFDDPGCITQEEYDEIMANAETGTYDNTPEYNTDESNMQQTSDEANPVDYTILSSRRLTEEDLSGLSKEELRIARNEIYARHGYIFKSADLKEYFKSKSWYQEVFSSTTQFDMNEYELYNVDFIKRHE